MYKQKLIGATESLVAYSAIKSAFDSVAKRADRQVKPLSVTVYETLLAGKTIPKEAQVVADCRFDEKTTARTLKEGINEFKKRFPEYGEKLQEVISETRETKRRYLVFGVVPNQELPEDIYLAALDKIGIPKSSQQRTLQTVLELGEILAQKKEEGLTELLIR